MSERKKFWISIMAIIGLIIAEFGVLLGPLLICNDQVLGIMIGAAAIGLLWYFTFDRLVVNVLVRKLGNWIYDYDDRDYL